ncbi:MAG TPA: hypothetical protein VG755_06135 [Nannocystaceae bacterium]|nr:hypothetical protein [Nannocystaceae bacterium]
MLRRIVVVVVLAAACGNTPEPAPAKTPPPTKSLPEVEKARRDVEAAQKASVQRTDDALDRAMKGEQVERGAATK